ncbi:Hypothetical_protein [Hexamita inflata]|uniref:Hypothetical_protein n=1 Tax=Hexamita inflata TaxID=28002 RepID=A0AA86PNR1_9EUKA|nr:Hypothetical protein HINF_LOCUS25824 [Hexamita inflata]
MKRVIISCLSKQLSTIKLQLQFTQQSSEQVVFISDCFPLGQIEFDVPISICYLVTQQLLISNISQQQKYDMRVLAGNHSFKFNSDKVRINVKLITIPNNLITQLAYLKFECLQCDIMKIQNEVLNVQIPQVVTIGQSVNSQKLNIQLFKSIGQQLLKIDEFIIDLNCECVNREINVLNETHLLLSANQNELLQAEHFIFNNQWISPTNNYLLLSYQIKFSLYLFPLIQNRKFIQNDLFQFITDNEFITFNDKQYFTGRTYCESDSLFNVLKSRFYKIPVPFIFNNQKIDIQKEFVLIDNITIQFINVEVESNQNSQLFGFSSVSETVEIYPAVQIDNERYEAETIKIIIEPNYKKMNLKNFVESRKFGEIGNSLLKLTEINAFRDGIE